MIIFEVLATIIIAMLMVWIPILIMPPALRADLLDFLADVGDMLLVIGRSIHPRHRRRAQRDANIRRLEAELGIGEDIWPEPVIESPERGQWITPSQYEGMGERIEQLESELRAERDKAHGWYQEARRLAGLPPERYQITVDQELFPQYRTPRPYPLGQTSPEPIIPHYAGSTLGLAHARWIEQERLIRKAGPPLIYWSGKDE